MFTRESDNHRLAQRPHRSYKVSIFMAKTCRELHEWPKSLLTCDIFSTLFSTTKAASRLTEGGIAVQCDMPDSFFSTSSSSGHTSTESACLQLEVRLSIVTIDDGRLGLDQGLRHLERGSGLNNFLARATSLENLCCFIHVMIIFCRSSELSLIIDTSASNKQGNLMANRVPRKSTPAYRKCRECLYGQVRVLVLRSGLAAALVDRASRGR